MLGWLMSVILLPWTILQAPMVAFYAIFAAVLLPNADVLQPVALAAKYCTQLVSSTFQFVLGHVVHVVLSVISVAAPALTSAQHHTVVLHVQFMIDTILTALTAYVLLDLAA